MKKIVMFLAALLLSVNMVSAQQPEYKNKAFGFAEQLAECAVVFFTEDNISEEVVKKVVVVGEEMGSYLSEIDEIFREPFYDFFDKALYYYFGKNELDAEYAEVFLQSFYSRITDAM